MSFTWPLALLALLAVPLAAAGYLLLERRRGREASRFGNPALVAGLVEGRPGRRRHLPPALALVALALLLVGVSRPRASLTQTMQQATVILAIDVSGSMAATDVAPSRLAAAQTAAGAFLEKVPKRYRVGIVSFSDHADTVLVPTTDRAAAKAALDNLRAGGGTAIGAAIARAVAVVRPVQAAPAPTPAKDAIPATILLLSDGAQTAGPPAIDAARAAEQAGVPVSTVTLGTATAIVEIPLPGGIVERVQVTPDPATLRTIAGIAGGTFSAAPDAEQLRQVYERLGSRLVRRTSPREITAGFAGAGALVLLAGAALSTLWFRRVL